MEHRPYCVSVFTSQPTDLRASESISSPTRPAADPYWCPWGHMMENRFQFADAWAADAFLVEVVSNVHEAYKLPYKDNPNFVHDAYSPESDDWTGTWFVVIRAHRRARVWYGNMHTSFRDDKSGWRYTLRMLNRVDPELVKGGGAFPLAELSGVG